MENTHRQTNGAADGTGTWLGGIGPSRRRPRDAQINHLDVPSIVSHPDDCGADYRANKVSRTGIDSFRAESLVSRARVGHPRGLVPFGRLTTFMKIALAFSGGGVRATVFHLGVLARLAREDLLPRVKVISSVSGGSLAAGLVFALSGHRWPSSSEYLQDIVPQIHGLLTSRNLQWSYAIKSLMFPWRLAAGRASVLGDELERQWHISGKLADLPISPLWIINATCFQTGKNWRFQRDVMGDYQTKYVTSPEFRLSHAMAASAAVPGLVGPLIVHAKRYQWSENGGIENGDNHWRPVPPKFQQLHLWDGGVYDNLGVESLFKPGEGLRRDTDFLIVSDASKPLGSAPRRFRWRPGYLDSTLRLVDVATDQVRSLRTRMLMDHFKQNPGSGAYLRLGLKPRPVIFPRASQRHPTLSEIEVRQASQIETTLRKLTHVEFSLLFRHGYEVADTTLTKHCDAMLRRVPRQHIHFNAA